MDFIDYVDRDWPFDAERSSEYDGFEGVDSLRYTHFSMLCILYRL